MRRAKLRAARHAPAADDLGPPQGPDRPAREGADVLPPVPQNPAELGALVRSLLGVSVAATPLMAGSDGPLAYLVHSFFEGRFVPAPGGGWLDLPPGTRPPGDCCVWANRGGGKTFLGAVATALDLLYKPGIEVRILGGSAEQARRMHEHLRRLFDRPELEPLLDGKTTDTRVRLVNGSRVEILSHSERSVRGVRVQKLRCDEVDLFDKALWEAAQLVTRSAAPIPGPWGTEVRGVVEVLSTMHVPMGLMWEIVGQSGRAEGFAQRGAGAVAGAEGEAGAPLRVLFRWGVVDALAHCGDEHTCTGCELEPDCAGRAKRRAPGESGHLSVRDARVLKRRVSAAVWASEMLCRRPSRSGCVYPEFDPAVHVLPADAPPGVTDAGTLVAGMDFGIRSPAVILWGVVDRQGVLTVVDEYAQSGRTLAEHAVRLRTGPLGTPAWVGIDPAGRARNDQTGQSNSAALRNSQLAVRSARRPVAAGIEAVRAMLAPAAGPVRLRIAPRCTTLIDALSRYHYPAGRPRDPDPEKDGPDHACDALRYLVINLDGPGTTAVGAY